MTFSLLVKRVKRRSHQVPLMFVLYFFNMPYGQHTVMKIAHGLGQVLLAKLVTFSSFPTMKSTKTLLIINVSLSCCMTFPGARHCSFPNFIIKKLVMHKKYQLSESDEHWDHF